MTAAGSSYTATYTCQYMENHRPVTPMGPQSAIGMATTSGGHPMVFAFDSAGVFHATVSADGAATQWTDHPIAGEVLAQYNAGATAKCFGVSQQAGSGPVSVLMAVTGQSGSNAAADDLWLLSNMDSSPSATWLTEQSARNWTKLPFNLSVGGINASSLSISDVRAIPVAATGQTLGAVYLTDASKNLQPFALDMSGGKNSAAWTQIPLASTMTSLADTAAGQPAATTAPGLYVLFSDSSGKVQLQWQPSGQFDSAVDYPVSNAATAISVLPFSQGASVYTHLFVADGQNIVLYPAAYASGAGVTVATASWMNGCKSLHSVIDQTRPNQQVVSVWGVTNAGQAFHMQATYDGGVFGPWSTPLRILSGVQASAAHISTQRGLTTLLASQLTTSGATLTELHKDHLTGGGANHWRKRAVHIKPPADLPASQQYQTLQTYTHRVQFLDGNSQSPAAGGNTAKATIATSATVVLEVNGIIRTVTPAQPISVKVDAAGYVDLMQEAPSPQQPVLTVSFPGANTVTIEPAYGVRTSIDSQLQTAVLNNNTQQFSWYKPQNGATLKGVSSTVTTANKVSVPTGAAGSQGASAIRAAMALASTGQAPAASHGVSSGLFDGVEAFLGDVCQAIAEGIEEIVSAAIEVAGKVSYLVVHFAESAFYAAINVVEDIAGAIVSVISWIGAGLEDIWHWLAFLFDWGNIFTIQAQIYYFYDQLLTTIADASEELMASAGTWIGSYGAKLQNGYKPSGQMPNQTTQASSQQASQSQQGTSAKTPASTDPRMSWGQNQLPPPKSNDASAVKPAGDSQTDPVAAAAAVVFNDLVTLAGQVGTDIEGLVTGSCSLQDAVKMVENDIGQLIDDFGKVVTALGPVLQGELLDFKTTVETPLDIPLFTALYSDVAPKSAPPFNALSLFCLLQAVPTTLAYGISTGGASAANFLPNAAADSTCAMIKQGIAQVPQPGASSQLRQASAPAARPMGSIPAAAGAIRYLLGLAHMLRALSTAAVIPFEQTIVQDRSLGPATGAYRETLIIDALVWGAEGALTFGIDLAEGKGFDDISPYMDGLNIVGAGIVFYMAYKMPGEDMNTALLHASAVMSIASGIIGVVEVIEGIEAVADSDAEASEKVSGACDILYGANELAEFALFVLMELKKAQNVVTQGTPVRCCAMVLAGLGEMVAGGLEVTSH